MKGFVDVTDRICEFAYNFTIFEVPESIITRAKKAILDTIGVTLAGTREVISNLALNIIDVENGKISGIKNHGYSIFGKGITQSLLDAVFINGVSAHSLEFDDIYAGMPGHPSVVLIPVIFGLGENLSSPGDKIIEAYLTGFEVQARINEILLPTSQEKGFHSTSITGVIGASISAAKLLGLNHDQMRAALGISASMACGLRRNFGTYTKPLHVGFAARNGVMAALLARQGFTAEPHILDGEDGFLSVFYGRQEIYYEVISQLGKVFALEKPGLIIKKYPSCYATHQGIDGALNIINNNNIKIDKIINISCLTSEISYYSLPYRLPQNNYEARFSMPFCLAATFLQKELTLRQFRHELLSNANINKLINKVEFGIHPKQVGNKGFGYTTVKVLTDDNIEHEYTATPSIKERVENWSDEEINNKFINCVEGVITNERAGDLISIIGELEKISDISKVVALLL